ncbi:uncharacterized protein TEOVI_000324400 [Trypanosoma equiperdum]|uniref:Uncharacterized protein n=2 Tax=Trypanozoon TaxID=39700 RepID=Q4FKA8_TRYB2|nr:hypothetical protein, conserved [Trypanosoma brucei brucei TREU927]EAN79159.1 hypothetical protein, conserved [Trypanosoma brucei brucei TREU927]CAJ17117.1 hypothetical protein Tb11.1380 [Trypanosoma brucei brucei TREU927]SCU71663.1 hypothetical protein, conserved [Trypanosoma equiperdum]
METAELARAFVNVEEECRRLRSEVAILERARRYQNEELSSLTLSSEQGKILSKNFKGRTIFIPIEAVGEVNNKAGELHLLVKERERLLRERSHLEAALQDATVRTTQAEEENNEFKRIIGLTGGETMATIREMTDAVALKNKLRLDIVNALQDREVIQETLKKQNNYLSSMVSELSTTDNIESDRANALNQLSEKQAELKSIRDEVAAMRRLLRRKEALLEKEKPVDELALIKSAETDRTVALYKLDKEREAVRVNDLSVCHRAAQIARLERRIEMIGDAVGGDESLEEERVDADLVEQLRKEIISLSRLHFDGSAHLELLDSDISDLDRRAAGLIRTTANVRKEMKRIGKEHKKYTNAQRKELEVEQEATEQEIKQIEKEVEALRQMSARNGRSKLSQ